MIDIAIAFLWLLVGIVVLLGVAWLFFYVLEVMGVAVPERLKQGVYLIVIILIVIYALTIIAGGARMPTFR
jgi:hypothetical membrane protein